MSQYEQLLAYAAGELSGPEAAEVEAILAADPAAAATVALYRAASAAMQAEPAAEPPPETAARAKAIFDTGRLAAGGPGLGEILAAAVARLVFDSRAEPALALAGLRGQATSFQLTYELSETPEAELDLHAELDGDERWRLVGQVVSRRSLGPIRVELYRAGGDRPIQSVAADERGMFVLTVEPGTYELRLGTGQGVTIVPDLRMT